MLFLENLTQHSDKVHVYFYFQVVFSDESIIQCTDEVSQYVRRRSGEAFNKDCVHQTVKHPTQIIVWSVISVFGTGRLYIVEGTMRQDQYITVLRNKLIPQLRARAHEQGSQGIGGFIFMHDGAPCHRGRRVTEFLEDQGIETFPWPGNSPDMNPIENLWAI